MNEQVTAVDNWSASADDLELSGKCASLGFIHWRGEEAGGLSTNSPLRDVGLLWVELEG